jgi:membrane associated rhomboid family serine protease
MHFLRRGVDVLPLSDINPTRRVPYFTYALIAINVLVFLWELGFSERELTRIFIDYSVVPSLVTQKFSTDTLLDFVRSMFFHGGWAHLLGNMLYLWIFGDNIEDRLGRLLYLVLYFTSGVVAALAQVFIDPNSEIPLVGASGAIAGVLGSYAVMFPGVRVRGLIFLGIFSQIAEFPALVVLGFWFVMQLFSGLVSLGAPVAVSGGVAFFAHVGGFITGAVLTWVFMSMVPQPPPEERREMLYQRQRRYW